jgi:hypothetical protein
MIAALFFKCHLLGFQAKSDAARGVFPTSVRVYIELSGKNMWFVLHNIKTTCKRRITVLHSQLTMMFIRRQLLASLQNETESVTSMFVIFVVEELKENEIQVTRKNLMAKMGPRIMGFT